MASELSWEQRGVRTREGLEPLHFLLGSWEGTGESHGQRLRGRLEVRLRMGGTWIEATETLWDSTGAIDHEDLTLYRLDLEVGHVRALQVMAHAWSRDHAVMGSANGLRWYHSPESPSVNFRQVGADGLRVDVCDPTGTEPFAFMDYRRSE